MGELFYVIFAQFVHISSSLLKADKRRGDTCIHLFPFAGFESDDRSGMVGHLFRYVLLQISVFYRSLIGERFVELDDKVVLEVFRNTTAVACRITDYLILFRKNLDVRTFVEGIYDHIRMIILRESETKKHGTFRRCHFGDYIVFCQVYFVVVRSCHFSFMCKPACPFLFVKQRLAHYRHNRELTIIIDPRTGLVCLFEPADFVGGIGILPSVSHFACLWSPEVHTPGTGNSRISITC